MSTSTENEEVKTPRDAQNWAPTGGRMSADNLSESAVDINVSGRMGMSPLQGFGQMWQKTYKVRLSGAMVTPREVVTRWKEVFPTYWPKEGRFHGPLTGIAPGEVAVLDITVGPAMTLSTGVKVMYADEESFTFMTPEGHMFAGWITFSAYEDDGATVAQVQALIRANDPMYEVGFRLGFGHKAEDKFWHQTLKNLAKDHGVDGAQVNQTSTVIDPRMQWSEARNIWWNAAIRTTVYKMMAPLRWLGLGKKKQNQATDNV